MAVISKEELIKSITARLGETPDDEGITFLENVSDTISDYENKIKGFGDWNTERENLKKQIKDIDANWRKKYTERFTKGYESDDKPPTDNDPNDEFNGENIQIKDIFEVKK